MPIVKHNKIWHYRTQRNGRRYSVSLKTRDKAEAESRAAKILREIESGEFDVTQRGISLASAGQRFLDQMKPRWSKANYGIREQHLKHLLAFFGPTYRLDSFNRKETDRYVKHRAGKVSNETINKELGTLRQLVRVVSGRVFALEKLPVDKKPQRALSEAEAERLLHECRNGHRVSPDLYDAVAVCIDTGLRSGELFGIRPKDLNTEKRELMVPTPKTHRYRVIPLTPRAFAVLKARAERRMPAMPLFNREDGTSHVERLRMPLERAYTRAGLSPERPWYTLRHTFATRLLEHGASIYDVKMLMGHTTVKTTEIYAHLQPQKLHGTIGLISKEKGEKYEAVVEKRLKLVK
jgi:integrase